jgi:hypothetical protein
MTKAIVYFAQHENQTATSGTKVSTERKESLEMFFYHLSSFSRRPE